MRQILVGCVPCPFPRLLTGATGPLAADLRQPVWRCSGAFSVGGIFNASPFVRIVHRHAEPDRDQPQMVGPQNPVSAIALATGGWLLRLLSSALTPWTRPRPGTGFSTLLQPLRLGSSRSAPLLTPLWGPTRQVGINFGVGKLGALVVSSFVPGGPAARSGIYEGDVLYR